MQQFIHRVVTMCAVICVLSGQAFAQGSGTLKAGTVLTVRMNHALSSESSLAGDKFSATVTAAVSNGRDVIVPAGTIVEGHVTDAQPAHRPSKSGTIAVSFDLLVFPDGTEVPIVGELTSTDPAERKRLDENEGTVRGSGSTKRNVIFIGGGAGAGAGIGAIAGSTAIGAGVGAGIGTAAVLLSKGKDAEVPVGYIFGVEIRRDVDLDGQPTGPDPANTQSAPPQQAGVDWYGIEERVATLRDGYDAALDVQSLRSGDIQISGGGYTSDEIEAYVSLGVLESAVRQYAAASAALGDDPALRGAGQVVVRAARQFDRVLARTKSDRVTGLASGWRSLRPDFATFAQSVGLSLDRDDH